MRLPALQAAAFAFSALFACAPIYSQQASPSNSPPQKAQTERQHKKQQKKVRDELSDSLTHVIEEDLIYILTKEERDAFYRLGTNEEREQYIEIIWNRRNPNPDSTVNDFKEEHYRRIAYAN